MVTKCVFLLELVIREMNRIDEIIYEETQKAAYEEQCEQGFAHQEQPNEVSYGF